MERERERDGGRGRGMGGTGRDGRETVGENGFYGTPYHRGFRARRRAAALLGPIGLCFPFVGLSRSEERRVGKECLL